METLIKQIEDLKIQLNEGNIDVYQFYEEVVMLVEFYKTN